MALPKPAQRRVFRPARRVSWGTRIFATLVFLLAIGAVAAFVVLVLPTQVAALSQTEATELRTAREASAAVAVSADALWTDMASKGSLSLPPDQLAKDLALARSTEKAADAALGHVQAAQAALAQIDGIPFQLHAPAAVVTDRPALLHLEKALGAAIKLAHGATLQLTIAQHVTQDAQTLAGPLNQSLANRDWTRASRTADGIQQDLKSQETASADLEALLDPAWIAWMDGMLSYATAAQQYGLNTAAGQTLTAQQQARAMAAATDRTNAALAAAQAGAAAWQLKTVKPIADTLHKELTAGS
ncbi:MAG: hypothetical protein M3077_09045 [Candidatus Dormibacteraeota bacterium]|nr:hypothetical protein [Candidatus Dormibacteraeota bacterium]